MNTELPVELLKWQKLCWKIAEEHGWHDLEPLLDSAGNINFMNTAVKLALIHSEVSEALEALRHDKIHAYYPGIKPEGLVVELADIIIRVFDLAESLGLDMQVALEIKTKYNATRTYRHGGKKL